MPETAPKRVALALELEWLYHRHSQVFAGTQRYARQAKNWICVVDEYVDRVLPTHRRGQMPYDGIIARAGSQLATRSRQLGIPVVNVWFNSPARKLPSVFCDFAAHGEAAAEHLIDRGFRRFGCVSAPSDLSHRVETDAFHATLAKAGFQCDCATVPIHPARHAGNWEKFQVAMADAVERWPQPVGVLVVFSDVTSRYVAGICQRHGRRVPEDVAIVAGSNELDSCLEPAPSLSAVESRYDQVGYEAARLLDDLMDGAPHPTAPVLIPPAGIVARQSTDFFAAEDPTIAQALRYISENCHHPIGVNDVAEAIGLTRRTLERHFKKQLGRPVFSEIRRLRLERAKRLLIDGDLSVKRIAQTSGFTSSSQMNQVFERFVGMSPTECRRQNRNTSNHMTV